MNVLDLYCGQGGAGMGYWQAGFSVTGVDIDDQSGRYPFAFVQADALDYLAAADLSGFSLIHASPPCQHYSRAVPARRKDRYPDLLAPTRTALERTGIPWIIENVPGAPMRPDVRLCGCQFGLWRLKRERWFETSWWQEWAKPRCSHPDPSITIIGHSGYSRNRNIDRLGFQPSKADWERAMGIDWMTQRAMSEAIPPAYTEYMGRLFLASNAAELPAAA